ncbi:MAG: hypothetical protein DRN04_09740 [Thermoprotei archaeon]|nr:MAG: hypothetical protein DRN04_09740 [Thermoprotei archaeon]
MTVSDKDADTVSKIMDIIGYENITYLAVFEDDKLVFWSGMCKKPEIVDRLRELIREFKATRVIFETEEGEAIIGQKDKNMELFLIAKKDVAFTLFELIRSLLKRP